jgi:hypothetical protein
VSHSSRVPVVCFVIVVVIGNVSFTRVIVCRELVMLVTR